jgi:DNA-directed RNA polymerase subunit RPC12/RpoP
MPLSPRLLDVDLTLECKYCGHTKTKRGEWFRVAHRFVCVRCKREVPITYSDKVALFNKHARLLETQAEVDSR